MSASRTETMAIGVDASRLAIAEKTGIETYAEQLCVHLPVVAPDIRFRYYVTEQPTQPLPRNVEIVILPRRRFWTQTALARELKRRTPDIFFSPVYTLPHNHPRSSVVTIHGLEFMTTPESYSHWHNFYHRAVTRYSVHHATTIIAASKNTKNDLVRYFHIPPNRITVVYNGVDRIAIKREPTSPATILSIGRLEKRKGTEETVRAFTEFKRNTSSDARLILAGAWGTVGREAIERAIAQSPFCNDISTPGYVTEKRKRSLLAQAQVLVFPSRYEGFGLPILEAMSAGVPVITTRRGSIEEIAQQAVRYINSSDIGEYAVAIERLLENPYEQMRMSQAGKDIARQFSWERCARETLAVLQEAKRHGCRNDRSTPNETKNNEWGSKSDESQG